MDRRTMEPFLPCLPRRAPRWRGAVVTACTTIMTAVGLQLGGEIFGSGGSSGGSSGGRSLDQANSYNHALISTAGV